MAHRGGLGQAGRAGGVDVERAIGERRCGTGRAGNVAFLPQRLLDARQAMAVTAMRPNLASVWQMRADRSDGVKERGADNRKLWRDDFERVPERGSGEVGVDQ